MHINLAGYAKNQRMTIPGLDTPCLPRHGDQHIDALLRCWNVLHFFAQAQFPELGQ